MKNIFTGIFLLVSACFMQAQTPNYYRNPDKIYPVSYTHLTLPTT